MPKLFSLDKDNFYTPAFCRAIQIGLLLLLPLLIFGAIRALESNSNRVEDWLPKHFEETRQLKWFKERFGSGEILVISWDGCSMQDPRSQRLAEALRTVRHQENGELLFRDVYTPLDLYSRLTAEPLNLSPELARWRLKGWLLGTDQESAALLAMVSETGSDDRHAAIEAAWDVAEEACELDREHIYFGGSSIDSVAIDNAAESGIALMNVGAYMLCLLLTWFCFRSWRVASLICMTALIAQIASLANLYYTGENMDSVSLLMASVTFVLSISGAVHLVNYYRETVTSDGEAGAPERAVRAALVPCGLATFTTAIGLGSLGCSHIVPIAKFGIYTTAAIIGAFGLIFLVVPANLKKHPPRNKAFLRGGESEVNRRRWRPLLSLIQRIHQSIVIIALIGLGLGAWGVLQIHTTIRLHDMFPEDAKIIRDYNWIEKHVGPLVPMEVVIHIPTEDNRTLFDHVQVIKRAADSLRQLEQVGAVIDPTSFLPPIPKSTRGTRATVWRQLLDSNRDQLRKTKYLIDEDGIELWRISVRVYAGDNVDFEQLLHDMNQQVDAVIADADTNADALRKIRITGVEYAGGVPLVHKAQRQLLEDLITSFLAAFALVALVMACVFWVSMSADVGLNFRVVLRGAAAGIVTMIPNILPPVLVFGTMGWLGYNVEMGTMMTASVALGIAVDDTLHFITWFRRGLKQGMSRYESTMFAYERCASAMVQTSIICGLGLSIFVLSPFVPISNFSWLMLILLGSALLGDLLVLPAILIGPLGALLESPKKSDE